MTREATESVSEEAVARFDRAWRLLHVPLHDWVEQHMNKGLGRNWRYHDDMREWKSHARFEEGKRELDIGELLSAAIRMWDLKNMRVPKDGIESPRNWKKHPDDWTKKYGHFSNIKLPDRHHLYSARIEIRRNQAHFRGLVPREILTCLDIMYKILSAIGAKEPSSKILTLYNEQLAVSKYSDKYTTPDGGADLGVRRLHNIHEVREKPNIRKVREEAKHSGSIQGRRLSSTWTDANNGWTDLHYMAMLDIPERVTELIEGGLDPNVKLNINVGPRGESDVPLSQFGFLEYLQSPQSLDPFPFGGLFFDGATPLFVACVVNSYNAASQLVADGASVEEKNCHGVTPLHIVAETNSRDLANLLIAHMNYIDERDHEGLTPLHRAVYGDNMIVAKLLIDSGANIGAACTEGNALHLAVYNNNFDFVNFLVNLPKEKIDIEAQGGDYICGTPLHFAAHVNCLEIAELLIGVGANVKVKNEYGETPAQLAAERNSLDVLKLLVKHDGHKENRKDYTGIRLLHRAAKGNALDVAKWLIVEKEVNIDVKDKDGNTPLHYAAMYDAQDVAKLLVERRASVREENGEKLTPLMIAKDHEHDEIAMIIQSPE